MRSQCVARLSWRLLRWLSVLSICHGNGTRRQKLEHKSKEDTWKSEELKKHLKAMQSESSNEKRPKERRHHREEDRDEPTDSRHRSDRKEKRDRHHERDRHAERKERPGNSDKERGERPGYPDKERGERRSYSDKERGERHRYSDREKGERHGYSDKERKERDGHPESDRHADKERDRVREHRKEKERTRDTEIHHMSEKHRTGESERMKEKKYRGENSAKEHGTSELSREERTVGESLEKSKHRSDDRERRHREKREKEKSEEHEDQNLRHRKHREDLNSEDPEKERRRSDRKHNGEPDGDKRHRSKREKEIRSNAEVLPAENSMENLDRWKEKHAKEKHSKRERKAHEKTNADIEGNQVYKHSRKSTSNQESDNEKNIEEIIQNTDTAYDDSTNYEEDFDDYDEDFEEPSEEERIPVEVQKEHIPIQRNKEVEEMQKAMLLENERITSALAGHQQKVHDHHDQEPEPKGLNSDRKGHKGVFIDFGSAKQRQVSSQNASKQKKRSMELLRLIDLDFSSTFSLLDLAPVKEYEMYIRNFGKSNTTQAYVQCNDDAVDREVQTEEIDIDEKWTQHPAEGAVVCGGHKNDLKDDMALKSKIDSQRLTSFLRSAAQVMAVLLEENRSDYQSRSKVHSKEPCMSISEGCFHLNTNLPFLQGRKIYHLQFSEVQRHLLLTVHGPSNKSVSAFINDKCLLCVWNIWQPSAPQKILMCESEVKCCCFSPGKASLVFAGTVDGSVLVWDLREDVSMHQTITIENANWTFRSVTFSTDGVFTSVNHTHPVKSIEPVPSAEAKDHGISTLSSQEEDVSGLSFQLASLDENGHLMFWVVVELRKVDEAGSQSDLGLIPGGKVKLIHSSSINLIDKFFHKDVLSLGIPETMNIRFFPQDSTHFVIGTDIGIVTHGTQYGIIDPPLQYSSLHNKLRPLKVTAIDFSPFAVPAFLVGCSDGCIRLHTMRAEYPVMQWNDTTGGQSIIALQWSLTRPTMFFVLDSASCIYMWDLLQNDLQPVAKESITSDQVLSMSVFGEPEKNNNLMGLALAMSSETVEVQYIKKKWAKSQPNELQKLELILQDIL
ncbi:cytoplasmic dynein 2 intermediate chain 1 isoform X2 [Pyxicephalus adspersus]|uniref:cytoplasmic dynein 2 intermediate chain 1 isoform X2 n=1 Tax=Pyxicephalus adspersus TaxID=30357 RepID=UPI003B5A072F